MTKEPDVVGESVAGHPRWSRRRVLAVGLGGAAAVLAAGAAGAELVSHGVLPGKNLLDRLDGACSVSSPPLAFSPPGPSFSGTFHSRARNRTVGYTIAYPPAHRSGDELPLVVMLHGYGGNHARALAGMTPAQAVALTVDGRPVAAMAMVTVDGGGGYWNPHPGDDPMAMVTDELIPLFAANDAVTHTSSLARIPVRVASGYDDPFYPGVQALASVLPAGAVTAFGKGCHTGPFFTEQEPLSLAFLARHLVRWPR